MLLVAVGLAQSAVCATSVYLHRALAHRSLTVHPVVDVIVREGIRDGRTVAELLEAGLHVVSREDVMKGMPEMLDARSRGPSPTEPSS